VDSIRSPLKAIPFMVALAIISGILIAFAFALKPIWWTAWLGPMLLIFCAAIAPDKWRRNLIMIAGLVAGLSMLSYHLMIVGWLGALLILLLKACLWTSAVKLAASFNDRGKIIFAILTVPSAFAAIDTLLIYLSPHGSISSLAYSQMDVIPVIQLASLGGIPLITFFVLMGSSLVSFLAANLVKYKNVIQFQVTVFFTAIILCGLAFGVLRVQEADKSTNGLVSMLSIDSSEPKPTTWAEFWDIYGIELKGVAKSQSVILLPEVIIEVTQLEAENVAQAMSDFSTRYQVAIITGIVVDEGDKITNRALIVEPNSSPQWYNKRYLIPGLESRITAGSKPFISKNGLGVAICKDMHFPTLGRDYSFGNASLILVPAYDFKIDAWMMSRVTALRGVEIGIPVARTARNGFSTLSDPYGRFIGEANSKSSFTALSANMPNSIQHRTLYSRFGDVFGWFCLGFWLLLIILDRRYRWQNKKSN
jgi:apolipoprotein N-acyltransferase